MISEKAVIHPNAKIADNVTIGPFSVIGDNVEIGEGTWIGPNVVIDGPTQIGKDNKFYQFASIGSDPQDKKYNGETTHLIIGDRNVFRENCTVSRGTVQGGAVTRIGCDNLLMAYTHVAHDCIIHNNVIMSNNATLAGHVTVEDYAIIGGLVAVHQFCSVGRNSFCGGGSIVLRDVLPFVMVSGYPAKVKGLNLVGLKRHAFDPNTILQLKRAYKVIYRQGLTMEAAVAKLTDMIPSCQDVKRFVDFIRGSERGIVR